MYKIYDGNNSILVNTLTEVRELTGASNEAIRSLFLGNVIHFNDFSVINYS